MVFAVHPGPYQPDPVAFEARVVTPRDNRQQPRAQTPKTPPMAVMLQDTDDDRTDNVTVIDNNTNNTTHHDKNAHLYDNPIPSRLNSTPGFVQSITREGMVRVTLEKRLTLRQFIKQHAHPDCKDNTTACRKLFQGATDPLFVPIATMMTTVTASNAMSRNEQRLSLSVGSRELLPNRLSKSTSLIKD